MFSTSTWEDREKKAAAPHLAKIVRARLALDGLNEFDLEAIAEAAISLLDERRDPDEDHCLAGDEGCGQFHGGQRGGLHWGSSWDEASEVLEYGIDQREILPSSSLAFGYHVD